MHALGFEFGSAAQLSRRPGSVWNCHWGNALKRSPEIIRKSRVSYPGPGFLFSATWPSLPKKHYNGLNQTIYICMCVCVCVCVCVRVYVRVYVNRERVGRGRGRALEFAYRYSRLEG